MDYKDYFGTLPDMEIKDILKRINADLFFKEYLPHIKRPKHKARGKDSNGKEIDFSPAEKKEILKALEKMVKDFKKK